MTDFVVSQSGPEWKPSAPEKFERCDCCGETAVVETIEEERFPYGDGGDAVMLAATVPVLSCWACGMQWTDHRGEDLRSEAVARHLANPAADIEGNDAMTDLEKAAAANRNANRLWRDPDARTRFEMETGLKPIAIGNGLEVETQHQSGQTEAYHRNFLVWAAEQSRDLP